MTIKYFFVLFLTFAVGVSFVWWNHSRKITVEKINALIEKEIPQNSDASQVKAFLAFHNFELSATLQPKIYISDFYTRQKIDEEKSQIKSVMKGIIRDTEKDLFCAWGITMEFYFDEQERLVGYNVKNFGTCP